MIWSFSDSQTFRRCQRQWYFDTVVAAARAKDPTRREAYLLSKLQSISAWRGSLVDHVIGKRVVPALKNGWGTHRSKILEYAREVFERQLKFGLQHRVREPGMIPTQAGDDFAAFHAVEYGPGIGKDEKDRAWAEVEQALSNLLEMSEFLNLLTTARDLLSQRALAFPRAGVTAKAVPDLIAFFDGAPPLIVDWKVHTFGTYDSRLQLTCYAVALTRCKPHKDFPPTLSHYTPVDVRLRELQLLSRRQRNYALSDRDVELVDSYIAESVEQMILALDNDVVGQPNPLNFRVAADPETCQRCRFRSLCWQEAIVWQEWKQTSFL